MGNIKKLPIFPDSSHAHERGMAWVCRWALFINFSVYCAAKMAFIFLTHTHHGNHISGAGVFSRYLIRNLHGFIAMVAHYMGARTASQ